MKRISFFLVLVIAFVLLNISTSVAGWVEIETDGTKTLIAGEIIRVIPSSNDEPGMIINAGNGKLTMLDDKNQSYATGTPEEFCAGFKKIREEEIQKLSDEERRLMEHMMGQLKTRQKRKPKVTIKKIGSGEKIAGYSTTKHMVLLDDRKYEELWMADVEVMSKKDSEAFMKLMAEFSACTARSMGMEGMTDIVPEMSREYLNLMQQGWLMKSVSHSMPFGGPALGTEVSELTQKSFSSSELKPPSGYRKVSIEEFTKTNMSMGRETAPQ